MCESMKKVVLTVLFFLFCCATILAQQVSFYTWNSTGFSFQAPVRLQVKENTETSYEVDGDALMVNIQLLEDPDTNVPAMKKTVKEIAGDIGITHITESELLKLKPGLLGVYIEGDLEETNACMAVILDTKSKMELCVTVAFEDGMEDIAIRILSSFTKK